MIRVLIVDDSAVVRKLLSDQLSRFEDILVVGSAMDPYIAREKIALHEPDVIVLDIEMPRMDGLTFLAHLMKSRPLPVVIVSSITREHGETALRALQLGAVEVIGKPGSASTIPEVAERLVQAIRAAARADVTRSMHAAPATTPPGHTPRLLARPHGRSVIAIGASTGGTKAIETVLLSMPRNCPPIVIVQHMPEAFTGAFAERLNQLCTIDVREARSGDPVVEGSALIAPGDHHMLLRGGGGALTVSIRGGPPVQHQRPSVDVLFQSVARTAGRHAVGVLLTGMGVDGAAGLLAMRDAGARTIAEAESSCVVFGMPKEAIRIGAAAEVVALHDMAASILGSTVSA